MLLWIIGKHGLLASSFQRILTSKNIPFIATSRTEVDIRDKSQIEAFLSMTPVTHIINCSGYTAVDRAEDEEENAFALNVIGPANLSTLSLPVVHFSTDYVFDGNKETPYTEQCRTNPKNIYGQTKRDGEKAILKNPNGIVLRISWLFGKEGKHFVSAMQQLLTEKPSLQIVSDQRGRPTFADDVVEATIKLIEKKEHGLFHFANQGETTWYEFAQHIQGHIGSSCTINPTDTASYGAKAYRPKNSVLSTEKIENLLGEKAPLWQNRLPEVLQ